jgi:hypothetical protein
MKDSHEHSRANFLVQTEPVQSRELIINIICINGCRHIMERTHPAANTLPNTNSIVVGAIELPMNEYTAFIIPKPRSRSMFNRRNRVILNCPGGLARSNISYPVSKKHMDLFGTYLACSFVACSSLTSLSLASTPLAWKEPPKCAFMAVSGKDYPWVTWLLISLFSVKQFRGRVQGTRRLL